MVGGHRFLDTAKSTTISLGRYAAIWASLGREAGEPDLALQRTRPAQLPVIQQFPLWARPLGWVVTES
jgi:hypothetical protein